MKRSMEKVISTIVVFVMVFVSFSNGFSKNTQAAINSKELASTYLSATVKYLNFGQKDTTTYDFNINKEAQKKGAVYSWYVKEDKGNQGVVTINSKTGVVTAKKAGTAYIRCKVTLADGTILRPEAKVIVRNNITEVDISNMPKDQTITAGEIMDFNKAIINTDAGKGMVSKGITRWEIGDDSAGVDKISEGGIVTPTKKGSFSVRAVSFQSKEKYNLWLKNKEANKNSITASSKWYKVTVVDAKGAATVATQEELDKALAAKDITQIMISTDKEIKFTIATGEYLNKTLIVDAPNADVDNYAIFKNIIIRAIKENTWNENANGNTFQVTSIKVRIIVNGNAEIKEIILDRQNSVINLVIEGIVHQITILQPSELNLSGDGEQIPITIEKTGDGSKITTSIPLNLECDQNSEIVLNPGAEGTTINKSDSTVELKVENNSNRLVIITTDNTGGQTINAGESGVSNGITQPTVTLTPPSGGGSPIVPPKPVPVSDITVTPTNMTFTRIGASATIAKSISPANATNSNVSWSSSDESVATVINGVVTSVAAGETTITATSEDGNKTDTCIVTVNEVTIALQFPDENLAYGIANWLKKDISEIISKDVIIDFIANPNEELYLEHNEISDMTGFEIFNGTDLKYLYLQDNYLTSFDASGLTNLVKLVLANNQLSSLNVSGLTKLTQLGLRDNPLTSVNVSSLTNLVRLNVSNTQLSSLDVSGLANLEWLYAGESDLTTINVSGLLKLEYLDVNGSQLTSLDINGLMNLTSLYAYETKLTTLNVSTLTKLINLDVTGTQLTSLNVSGLVNLNYLYAYETELTTLDVSTLTKLIELDVSGTQLTSLNLSGLVNLKYLYALPLTRTDIIGLDDLTLDYADFYYALSSLTIDGKSVEGFSAEKQSYNIEVPFGSTYIPIVDAIADYSTATVKVTPPISLPGTTQIDVLGISGSSTYYVNFVFVSASKSTVSITPTSVPVATYATVTVVLKDKDGAAITGLTYDDFNVDLYDAIGAIECGVIAETGTLGTYEFIIKDSEVENLEITIQCGGVSFTPVNLMIKTAAALAEEAVAVLEVAAAKNLTIEANLKAAAALVIPTIDTLNAAGIKPSDALGLRFVTAKQRVVNAIDIFELLTAKLAVQALSLAWDTDLATTISTANTAIGTASLPPNVTAVAAEGTLTNVGNVVVTITSGAEIDATIILIAP